MTDERVRNSMYLLREMSDAEGFQNPEAEVRPAAKT